MEWTRVLRKPVFWILLGIVSLASYLRIVNATWGVPELHPYRGRTMESLYPDEINVVGPMRAIAQGELLQVGTLTYLPVQALLGVAVTGLTGWGSGSGLYLAARSVSMLASIGSVILLFFLGRTWNERTGLIAAGFLAVSMGAAREAHWANAESLSAFWALLAMLLVFRLLQSQQLRGFFFLGLSIGLSFCSKYLGLLFLHLPLLAILFSRASQDRSVFSMRVPWKPGGFRGLSVSVLGFAVVAIPFLGFYIWGNFDLVLDAYQKRLAPWAADHGAYGTFPEPVSAPHYLTDVFPAALGGPLYACALAGIVLCTFRRSRTHLLLMAGGVPFLAFLELARYHQIRFTTALLPVFCLLAAYVVDSLLSARGKWFRSAGWVLLLGILFYSGFYTYAFVRVLNVREDVRFSVDQWIESRQSSAEEVAVLGYDGATNSLAFIQYDGMDRLAGSPAITLADQPRLILLPRASSDILFQFLRLRDQGYRYTEKDWWPISGPSEETIRWLERLRDEKGYRLVRVFRNDSHVGGIEFAVRLPFDTFRTTNLEVSIYEREPTGQTLPGRQ